MPRTNSATDPLTQKSKYVSYLLRHDVRVGDLVDDLGFASLKQLNTVVRKDGHKLLTEDDLIAVTENPNTKKRFEYEYRPIAAGQRNNSARLEQPPEQLPPDQRELFIRALNGHSFPLKEVIFEPYSIAPPEAAPQFAYHATNHLSVDSILREGLKPMGRQFVHMYEQAGQVRYDGKRNTLLRIGPLNGRQLTLYRSKNGYIQCPHVIPPELVQRVSR